MKYTKYFGLISRHQGQLNLLPSEFQRMMNIVHLEHARRVTEKQDTWLKSKGYK